MSEDMTLLIRGWINTANQTKVIADLLGENTSSWEWNAGSAEWTVAAPLTASAPVGRVDVVVAFEPRNGEPVEVTIVPGSQGCLAPAGHSAGTVPVTIEPGSVLLLDGRCWFRTDPALVQTRLFAAVPAAGRAQAFA